MEQQALSEELCRKYFSFLHEKIREADCLRTEQQKNKESHGIDSRDYFHVFDQETDWNSLPTRIQRISAHYIPFYKAKLKILSEELTKQNAIEIFQHVFEDICLADYEIEILASDQTGYAGRAGMVEYIDEIGWKAINNDLQSIELESDAFTTISVAAEQITAVHKFYSKMDDMDMRLRCSDAVLGAFIAKDYPELSVDEISYRIPKLLETYRPYYEQVMYGYFDFWTTLMTPLTAKDRWEKRLRKYMPRLMAKLEEMELKRMQRIAASNDNSELPF